MKGSEKKGGVWFLMHRAPPDGSTNARLVFQVAAALSARGDAVTVLCSRPMRGLGKSARRRHAGVRMVRFCNPGFSYRSTVGRLVNAFFVDLQTALRLLFARRVGVVVADSTSPFLGLAAWLRAKVRRTPYVYLSTELYPEAAIAVGALGRRGLLARLWRFANRRVLGSAARVVVISEAERGVLGRNYPGIARTEVIHNWADPEEWKPVPPEENPFRREHGLEGKLALVYSGNIGRSHDMDTVLDAAALLRDEEGVRFVIIGGGSGRERIERRVRGEGLGNVLLLPLQPAEVLKYSLSSGDFSVASLVPGITTIPSRVYPAMAAGQALLCVAEAGSGLGRLVEEEGAGLRFESGQHAEMAAAIRGFLKDRSGLEAMKRNARAAVEARYATDIALGKYLSVIDAAVAGD